MAFKMKGFSGFRNSPAKQKKDPYTKKDYDFLKDQKEERVHVTDYLTKDKSSGPWEKEKTGLEEIKRKPSRKEIDDSFIIGDKLANFDTPSDILDHQMKQKKKK